MIRPSFHWRLRWLAQSGYPDLDSWEQYYKTDFAVTHSLWLYFDALFDGLSEFKTVHICICHKDSITITKIDCEKLQVQTQIMNQNLAIILWHLCYGKISFIVLVPDQKNSALRRGQKAFWNNNYEKWDKSITTLGVAPTLSFKKHIMRTIKNWFLIILNGVFWKL